MAYKLQKGNFQARGQIGVNGRLYTDDATEATTTTDGALQTDGGLSVAKSAVIGKDLDLLGDGAIMNWGANKDVVLTHVHNEGLLFTGETSNQLQFSDANSYISNPGAGLKLYDHAIIEVEAATSIQMDSPIVDFEDDGVILQFGADDDVTLTHVHNDGLRINGAKQLQFGDAATYIAQSADGAMSINGEVDIALNASAEVTVANDLTLQSDAAVFGFGADAGTPDTTFTHVADTGLILNSSRKLMFNDATQFIHASSNAILELGATDEIGLTATLVDMDANLDLDGTANISGLATFQTGLVPDANDGAYLGTAALSWSDLHLAEGGVINWDDGDATLTQAGNVVTLAGATFTGQLTNGLSAQANKGISMTSYDGSAAVADMQLDIDGLATATIDMAADKIAYDQSGAPKGISISDFVTAMAGAGLKAKNGVLSTEGGAINSGSTGVVLKEGYNVFDAISESIVAYLPGSPEAGDVIWVKVGSDVSTSITLSITGSSSTDHKIDGSLDAVVIDSPYAAVGFLYNSGSKGDDWRIV